MPPVGFGDQPLEGREVILFLKEPRPPARPIEHMIHHPRREQGEHVWAWEENSRREPRQKLLRPGYPLPVIRSRRSVMHPALTGGLPRAAVIPGWLMLAQGRRISYNILMTVESFRRLLSRRPFEPFQVVLSSGERYEVRHPEMALLTRTTLYIGVDPDNQGIPADSAFCSLLHVTAIEPLNGKPRTRRKK